MLKPLSIPFFAVLATSCVSTLPDSASVGSSMFGEEIRYVSVDMSSATVFSKGLFRSGPLDLTLTNPDWPSSPVKHFDAGYNVSCVSIGPSKNTVEYAIKRPIKSGDKYKCLATTFRVIRCFDECSAAIIERESPVSTPNEKLFVKSYLYVDACRGVIIISNNRELDQNIPLDAELLRGAKGILAANDYSECSLF